ncbi:MAG: hypothetical protein ACYDAN_08995 [Candidatus Limnocylindrales bacterium]
MRPIFLAAVAAALLLAACGGGTSSTPTSAVQPSGVAASAPASAGASGTQFGGDVCSALTKADIEAAAFPQGPATFDSTDTQKDANGNAVVCQYLVKFGGNPSIVGAVVTLFDDSEATHRAQVLLTASAEPVSGVGTEASVVMAAPGLYEVWVTGAHGKFTVSAQDKTTAIALAKLAVARD